MPAASNAIVQLTLIRFIGQANTLREGLAKYGPITEMRLADEVWRKQ